MPTVKIIRIDPFKRTIAAIPLRAGNDATPRIRQIVRANNVHYRQIAIVEQGGKSAPIISAANILADESWPKWKLRGCEDTAGIGILTGRRETDGVLVDVPVSVAWIRERIEWLEGENWDQAMARALEQIQILNDDVKDAIMAAVVTANGDIWITADAKALVGGPLQTLGLGTERSGGQKLTELGKATHALLTQPEGIPDV